MIYTINKTSPIFHCEKWGGSFVKVADCPVKNRVGEVLIYMPIKTPLPIFTGCKLCLPGMGIEATGHWFIVELSN